MSPVNPQVTWAHYAQSSWAGSPPLGTKAISKTRNLCENLTGFLDDFIASHSTLPPTAAFSGSCHTPPFVMELISDYNIPLL